MSGKCIEVSLNDVRFVEAGTFPESSIFMLLPRAGDFRTIPMVPVKIAIKCTI